MNNNSSSELLNEIYKNAKLGIEAIDTVSSKIDHKTFKNDLNNHAKNYTKFIEDTRNELSIRNTAPEDNNLMSKANLWSNIQVNTLGDKSVSHVAELMIKESNLGIIETTRKNNMYNDADTKSKEIAANYIKSEEDYIKIMENYL